jgi:hypothetical protein
VEAGGSLVVAAEVVVGVAEAVPGVGLSVRVSEPFVDLERLVAGGDGLLEVSELGVVPADHVKGLGLPAGVVDGSAELERLAGVVKRLVVSLL